MAVSTVPVTHRRTKSGWDEVDQLVVIEQINPNGSWDTTTLLGPGLEIKIGESGWLLWRRRTGPGLNDVTFGGHIPPDKVVAVSWSLT